MKKLIIILLLICYTTNAFALAPTSIFNRKNQILQEYSMLLTKYEKEFNRTISDKFKQVVNEFITMNPFNTFLPPSPRSLIQGTKFVKGYIPLDDFRNAEYPTIIESLTQNILMIVHTEKFFDYTERSREIQDLAGLDTWDNIYQHVSDEDFFQFRFVRPATMLLDIFDSTTYNYPTALSSYYTRYVLVGMYLNLCHYCAFRSLLMRYMMAWEDNETQGIEIHMPLKYIYDQEHICYINEQGEYDFYYNTKIIQDAKMRVFEKYVSTLDATSIDFAVYLDGELQRQKNIFENTYIKLYIWTEPNTKKMYEYLTSEVKFDILEPPYIPPVKAFIFDLGKTIIHYEESKIWDVLGNWSKDKIRKIQTQFEMGIINGEMFYQKVKNRLKLNLTKQEFKTIWNSAFSLNLDMFNFIFALKDKYDIYAFSNANKWHYKAVKKLYPELFRCFSGCFLSFQTAEMKPNQSAYDFVQAHISYEIDECVYIDDTPVNVTSAISQGWRGIVFIDYADLIEKLSNKAIYELELPNIISNQELQGAK